MKLATATKVRLAGVLYRAVRTGRRLLGLPPDSVICTRNGLVWGLNLREGIQFSIYLFGAFERETARALARLLPVGGVAVDVGANIGAQTLPMARHVGAGGRVIAIEPTVSAVEALRRNLDLNPELAQVVTVRAAALVAPGEHVCGEYYSSWPLGESEGEARGRHEVHRGVANSAAGSVALTLDELVAKESLSRLDVVKIDVDGREVRVLRGASATLATLRPSLILELAPYALVEQGDSIDEVIGLVRQARYRFVDEESLTPLPDDPAAIARSIPDGGSINVVALPLERPLD
jgi:FkbM family methyltransferase